MVHYKLKIFVKVILTVNKLDEIIIRRRQNLTYIFLGEIQFIQFIIHFSSFIIRNSISRLKATEPEVPCGTKVLHSALPSGQI